MFHLTYSSSCLTKINFIIIIIFLGSIFFRFSTASTDINCYDYAKGKGGSNHTCRSGPFLPYPFWYMKSQGQQYHCGYPGLGMTCSPNGRTIITISNQSYYVIERKSLTIAEPEILTIVEPDFVEKTCPRPCKQNLTIDHNSSHSVIETSSYNDEITFFCNCTSVPPKNLTSNFLGNGSHHLECLNYNKTRSYGFFNIEILKEDRQLLHDWSKNYCKESVVVPVKFAIFASKFDDYKKFLETGFWVGWKTPIKCQRCESSGGFCAYNDTASSFHCSCKDKRLFRLGADSIEYCFSYGPLLKKILIGVSTGVGGLMLITLLFIYHKNQRKRRRKVTKSVEQFLENYGCGSFRRYKYRDIKKMTNNFKDKLGQGGYGSVFKGKLLDGRLVAVKVLINDPKKNTNGEDFMNEVATIGRTNHVNIVGLLGYCSSGSNRALVYEFMPKGSLEKFIYAKREQSTTTERTAESIIASTTSASNNEEDPLGWEKLYEIALGIARGLEYLHRGCNTGLILHFDIKPHNILLDENLCPKISDFGLAKLCPARDSIVSMLSGGRGTIGYIAPEVYNRNFGGVSHKSDVYSYGMMVLEMVGGRKNIDPFVNNTSEIYFPGWIYNQLEKNKDKIEGLLKFEEAFHEEIARKMIMVGLWCIQNRQADRPAMGKVAEMLEGNIKDLQMPPNPCMDSLPPPSSTT